MDKLVAIGFIIIVTFLASLGMFFVKLGSNKLKNPKNILDVIKLILNKYILGGTILYFLGSLLFIWILTTQELSYAYPLTGIAYFFIIFLSVKFLKEKMNKYKWLGVLLIILGVVIISI